MTADNPIQPAISESEGAVMLRVKVVPGASRERIVGMLGDRLKLSVAAAPEAGKANQAVCRLLAKALGLAARDVSVSTGQTQPNKTIRIGVVDARTIAQRLTEVLSG